MKRFALAGLLLLQPARALATERCESRSWYANQRRTGKNWAVHVLWVAVGRITRIEHHSRPDPDCVLPGGSGCVQFDEAILTFEVARMEKGKAPESRQFELLTSHCAKPVPAGLDTGATYRFFGNDGRSFVTYELASQPKKGM